MKIAALISGGKDSIYAAFKQSKQHELVCLVSVISENKESYMFHIPNIHLVKTIAKAIRLPLIEAKTKGEKEKELNDLEQGIKQAIKKYGIEGIVTGAIKSNYQKERIDKLCKKLKISSLAPLWHIDEEKYMKELIKDGFDVIITGIAAEGLNKNFLGKQINKKTIEELKKINIHLSGEGGEFETLVLNCPLYKKRIEIKNYEIKIENEFTGIYIIKDVALV